MPMKIRTALLGLALLLALAIAPCQTAIAEPTPKSCVSEPVTVHGDPSMFQWIAKTKAHANWRQKVRSMPGLGDPYANWKRAENAKDECTTSDKGTICEFTGIPCRKGIIADADTAQ